MLSNMTRRSRRIVATGAVLAALAGGGVAAAGAASATAYNGVLESGEFGLYYSPNFGGPVLDLYSADTNFADNYFPGTTTKANDNTASYKNRDTYTWWVYTDKDAGGTRGYSVPGGSGNFGGLRNEVSSAYPYEAD
jgi:hypothetical protein